MMLAFDKQYLGAHGLDPDAFGGFVQLSGQPTTHFNVLKYSGLDPRRPESTIERPCILQEAGSSPSSFIVSDDDMPCRLEQNQLFVKTLEHFEYPRPCACRWSMAPAMATSSTTRAGAIATCSSRPCPSYRKWPRAEKKGAASSSGRGRSALFWAAATGL